METVVQVVGQDFVAVAVQPVILLVDLGLVAVVAMKTVDLSVVAMVVVVVVVLVVA